MPIVSRNVSHTDLVHVQGSPFGSPRTQSKIGRPMTVNIVSRVDHNQTDNHEGPILKEFPATLTAHARASRVLIPDVGP